MPVLVDGGSASIRLTGDELPLEKLSSSKTKEEEDAEEEESTGQRVLMPMYWGLVPAYVKGDPADQSNKPINARLDTLSKQLSKRGMFHVALKNNRRGVLPVDGFFEWSAVLGDGAATSKAAGPKKEALFISVGDQPPTVQLWQTAREEQVDPSTGK